MTAGSLPEGLAERCVEAAKRWTTPMNDAEWGDTVRAVLAVAAPALREQALREAAQVPTLTLPAPQPNKVRDLEAENSRLNAELMRERAWRNMP